MNAPHPDLELLSALVDGYDDEGTGDHVRACAACADRVASLGRASAAIAAVPRTGDDDGGLRDRAGAGAPAGPLGPPRGGGPPPPGGGLPPQAPCHPRPRPPPPRIRPPAGARRRASRGRTRRRSALRPQTRPPVQRR